MRVLITGAFGTIGHYTTQECLKRGYSVRLFDVENSRTKKAAKRMGKDPSAKQAEVVFGDLLNIAQVGEAVKDVDAVIHLAAMIPPQSEKRPALARYINVEGTAHLISVMKRQAKTPRLIFASSVAVYGDRMDSPYIEVTDPLDTEYNDEYGKHKIECERIIRESGIDFVLFRLSAIFGVENLKLDPLMFDMPLNTCIEPCTASNTAFALTEAVENERASGKTLHLGGGESSRTTYRELLDTMLGLFGLGNNFLPEAAFSTGRFHCGYLNTRESQEILGFQRTTLKDFYAEVASKFRVKKFFISQIRPLARMVILLRSPYYTAFLKDLSAKKLGAAKLFLRQIFQGRLLQP